MKQEFRTRLKTVYSYNDRSDPPSILLTQWEEGVDEMKGMVLMDTSSLVRILNHISEIRPEVAKDCARVYWRASKRGKREAFGPFDEVGVIESVKPVPHLECPVDTHGIPIA